MNHNFGDKGSVADQKHFVWLGSHIYSCKVLLSRRSNMDIDFSIVVDPYTLNLEFGSVSRMLGCWPNLDPDPGLY